MNTFIETFEMQHYCVEPTGSVVRDLAIFIIASRKRLYYVLQHGWYMQNNSVATPFNMLTTSRSCGNIRYFDQNYQVGKITFQVSVLIIKYLVAVSFG